MDTRKYIFGGSLLAVVAIIVLSSLHWVGGEVEARPIVAPSGQCDIDAGEPALPWAVSGTAWAECSIGYVAARQVQYFRAAESGTVVIANTTPAGDAWLRLKNSDGYGDKKANLTERIPVDAESTADVVAGRWYALMLLGSADGQTITGTVSLQRPNSAPAFADGPVTRSVVETADAGSNIGEPVSATDPDGDVLTYSLGGTDADAFAIGSASGQLQTKSPLDYDTRTIYLVTVSVSDGKDASGNADDSVDAVISVTINVTADWDRAFLLTAAKPELQVQHDWGDGQSLELTLLVHNNLPSLSLTDYRPDTQTIGEDVTWKVNRFGSDLRRARFQRAGYDDFVVHWTYERSPATLWKHRGETVPFAESVLIPESSQGFNHDGHKYILVAVSTYAGGIQSVDGRFYAAVGADFRNLTLYVNPDDLALVVNGERYDFDRALHQTADDDEGYALLEWETDRAVFAIGDTVDLMVVNPLR